MCPRYLVRSEYLLALQMLARLGISTTHEISRRTGLPTSVISHGFMRYDALCRKVTDKATLLEYFGPSIPKHYANRVVALWKFIGDPTKLGISPSSNAPLPSKSKPATGNLCITVVSATESVASTNASLDKHTLGDC